MVVWIAWRGLDDVVQKPLPAIDPHLYLDPELSQHTPASFFTPLVQLDALNMQPHVSLRHFPSPLRPGLPVVPCKESQLQVCTHLRMYRSAFFFCPLPPFHHFAR